MWEKGGNYLCLMQKHTGNTSCILSMAFARPSYALRLSTHSLTGADGGKKKYPLNTSQKKFYPLGTTNEYFEAPYEEYPHYDMRSDSYPHQRGACRQSGAGIHKGANL